MDERNVISIYGAPPKNVSTARLDPFIEYAKTAFRTKIKKLGLLQKQTFWKLSPLNWLDDLASFSCPGKMSSIIAMSSQYILTPVFPQVFPRSARYIVTYCFWDIFVQGGQHIFWHGSARNVLQGCFNIFWLGSPNTMSVTASSQYILKKVSPQVLSR